MENNQQDEINKNSVSENNTKNISSYNSAQLKQQDIYIQDTNLAPSNHGKNRTRRIIATGVAGIISYIAYILGIALGGGFISIVTGPALGVMTGTICLWRLAKLPFYRSALVSIVSIYALYITTPFGLPSDGRLELLLPFLIVTIVIFITVALIFTAIGQKKRFVDIILALALVLCLGPLARSFKVIQSGGERKKDVQRIYFQLYKPNYAPESYNHVDLSRAYIGQYESDRSPYYLIKFKKPGMTGYSMFQLKTPLFYHPPEDCGEGEPEFPNITHRPEACTKIGQSKAGCDVYVWQPNWTNQGAAFCELNGTLVTLFSAPLTLDNREIIAVFDGLEKSDGLLLLKLGPN